MAAERTTSSCSPGDQPPQRMPDDHHRLHSRDITVQAKDSLYRVVQKLGLAYIMDGTQRDRGDTNGSSGMQGIVFVTTLET